MRTNRFFVSLALVALAAWGLMPAPATAQLANASASALGLSGNNTATVRGFGAISVNPAGLAMPGSGFSLTFPLLSIQARSGLDPITLSDLTDFEDIVVPDATKQTWLDEITADGGQTGTVGVDISELALTLRQHRPASVHRRFSRRRPAPGHDGGLAVRKRRQNRGGHRPRSGRRSAGRFRRDDRGRQPAWASLSVVPRETWLWAPP